MIAQKFVGVFIPAEKRNVIILLQLLFQKQAIVHANKDSFDEQLFEAVRMYVHLYETSRHL